MTSEHTEGPWDCIAQNPAIIRSATAKCEVARASDIYMSRAERIANARLIAAAPDLLEALKGALSVIDRAGFIWLGENNAHEAIARAEGRS